MTTTMLEKERNYNTRMTRNATQEATRTVALERLVTLLEGEAEEQTCHVRFVRRGDRVSQLARLRKAHAHYALETMEDMVRVADGAWLRRRYN